YEVEYHPAQTNMVFISPPDDRVAGLQAYLADHNVKILGGSRIRLVTHLDINREDVERVIDLIKSYSG
ncbi:MAG: low-specificity L-threonine aldolase, partial [Desulfocapsaceae bacterium]